MEVPPAGNRRLLIKAILNRVYRPLVQRYLRKDRRYTYKGLDIVVRAGVFHPGFFHSTHLVLRYLDQVKLAGKRLLELGAGSGLIALHAAKQKAEVSATDISTIAIRGLKENAEINKLNLNIIHSDLFNAIPPQLFDIIVINPPYYRGKPANEQEHAWYYGEDEEYFRRLFAQLRNYTNAESLVCMVLSQDCPLTAIQSIAAQNTFSMKTVMQKKKYSEMLYIMEFRKE